MVEKVSKKNNILSTKWYSLNKIIFFYQKNNIFSTKFSTQNQNNLDIFFLQMINFFKMINFLICYCTLESRKFLGAYLSALLKVKLPWKYPPTVWLFSKVLNSYNHKLASQELCANYASSSITLSFYSSFYKRGVVKRVDFFLFCIIVNFRLTVGSLRDF